MLSKILQYHCRPRIILGGGPIGSSCARILAESGNPVTLINHHSDLGSHNDKSRLARLAHDGTRVELAESYKAVHSLLALDKRSPTQIITSKPGMLFIASPDTELASNITRSATYNPSLKRLTALQLASLFPDFPMVCPTGTLFWYDQEGYVVDPKALVMTNRQLAAGAGCEIIDGKANLASEDNYYLIETNTGHHLKTQELYLLAGARNKAIAQTAQLKMPEWESTHLTAISTQRYTTESIQTRRYMPITLGCLYLPNFAYPFHFSTMPESLNVIKTRLSGPDETERVSTVDDKFTLDDQIARQRSQAFFEAVFPFFKETYDFTRCITYRNCNSNVHGLSFFSLEDMRQHHGALPRQDKRLISTLGCYGVHVKYADSVARGIVNFVFHQKHLDGFHIDLTRLPQNDIVRESLNQHTTFLDASSITEKIGRTPIKRLSHNVFLKMEGTNLTGSIKDRVALHVLLKKLEQNEIKHRDTLVISSSGSYGYSLYAIKQIIKQYLSITLNLIIVTPHSYREKSGIEKLRKKKLSEFREDEYFTKQPVDSNMLLYVDGDFLAAIKLAKQLCQSSNYVYLDQQYDEEHVKAHKSTAEELAVQLPEVTDIVVTVGTGATATGLHRFFPKQPIRIHTRRTHSGTIEGLTDPSKYRNFFNPNSFFGYNKDVLDAEEAIQHKHALKKIYDLSVSESTGAAISIANDIKKENPDAVIAIISPGSY